MVTAQSEKPVVNKQKAIRHLQGKMLGADISFLPQLEAAGKKFYSNDQEQDVLALLKSSGFNYIRLRIFNEPANDSGYSPKKGFCDLVHTLQMAMRIKKAGLKLLLDFHYSDTWADPGKQYKPLAWQGMDFKELNQSVYDFTITVMLALKGQGTLPDMVQVGNEINHGMIWPDAGIQHLDTLASFLKSGIAAVKSVSPTALIMLHIACGGQNEESRFFIDNMVKRQVVFDIIGESYYPQWHGSPEDLKHNLTDLAGRYEQDLIVVEYSQKKQDVNDIVFGLPGNKGIGTCIWEPLSWGETFFEKDGKSNALLEIYPLIHKKYGIK
jgi:arabinogalactan endo-1,4-beta-galactosidase